MDYTGYTRKFPNNRPLNAFEREHRLLQKKRLDVVPLAQLCVVKMNSNGLVSVDRWFAARGFAALLGAIGIQGRAVFGVEHRAGHHRHTRPARHAVALTQPHARQVNAG